MEKDGRVGGNVMAEGREGEKERWRERIREKIKGRGRWNEKERVREREGK